MARLLRQIDEQLCRGEKLVAGSLFLLMSFVMLAAVVADIFSRAEGRLSLIAIHLVNLFGAGVDVHSHVWHHDLSPYLNVVVTFLLVYAGLRTMVREPQLTRPQAAGRAVVITGVLSVGILLLEKIFPNGVVWGADVALACMLWVGFLGASIATQQKRHLALEMGEKIWPKAIARYVRALAMLATAGMCVFLLYLSWISLRDHYGVWHKEWAAGNPVPTGERLSGANTKIPVWLVFAIFPYTFIVMGLRFVGLAAEAVFVKPSPEGEQA